MSQHTPRELRRCGLAGRLAGGLLGGLGLCVLASCAGGGSGDASAVNAGLARFELEALGQGSDARGQKEEGTDAMAASEARLDELTQTDAPSLAAPLSPDELSMLVNRSRQDIEEALRAGSKPIASEAGTAGTPGSAPGLAERSEASGTQTKPVDVADVPRLTSSVVPGWLRAFSTAVVGPLNATGHERRRASRIADGAALMATQMLMPAISEDDVVTLEEQIADVAEELASLLRDQASGAADPGRVYLTMAALEAIRPGVLSELAEDGAGELGAILSPPEVEAVRAARAIASGLADEDDRGDPNALADLLDEVATGLRPHTDIKISEAQLCRRVVGFGQYTPLASQTFVAGRSSRVIVYTELDRFAHRPVTSRDGAGEGEQWAVEVAQSVTMYVSRGDRKPVWHEPEQRVLQTSRRQIHDLYLVQMITLPPNLGVGSYELRVRVRDLAGNSVDERLIPIRIVADAGLIQRAS